MIAVDDSPLRTLNAALCMQYVLLGLKAMLAVVEKSSCSRCQLFVYIAQTCLAPILFAFYYFFLRFVHVVHSALLPSVKWGCETFFVGSVDAILLPLVLVDSVDPACHPDCCLHDEYPSPGE